LKVFGSVRNVAGIMGCDSKRVGSEELSDEEFVVLDVVIVVLNE